MGLVGSIMPGSVMRRRLMLVCALLAYVLQADAKTLHVVTDNNYPPYLFLDTNGRPEGYIVDLWHLWEQKTGVHVDLQPMQWSNALQRMHDRQADVIDLIFRTPARETLYDFSQPYDAQPVGIYVDPSISGIHDVQSLNGFLVGVERGDACAEQLARQGITNQVAYPGYVAILDAVRAGDIKIFCMDDSPANYYLYLYRDQKKFAKAFTLYLGEFRWAVTKGDKATFDLVEQGMARITPAERQALRNKWFNQPVQFRPYLRILAFVILGALAALAATLLWIRSLRRAVHARTAEIQLKNAQLERTTHALMVEQAQLRTLVENSPDAMALKDKNNVYVHCNAGAQALLGLPDDRIIGHKDDDLFADKAFAGFVKEGDEHVMRTGQPHRYEAAIAAPDGTNARQLTFDPVYHGSATVCDHSRSVIYNGDSGGTSHLWKLDLRTGGVSQLTNSTGELIASCGGSGDPIFYWGHLAKGTTSIYKLPATGGTATRVSDRVAVSPPFVSLDGKHVLFATPLKDGSVGGALLSADTGELETEISVSPTFDISVSTLCWMPDNRSVALPDLRSGVANLWSQPVLGNAPQKQLTHFTSGKIWSCAFSADGKYLAISHGSRQSDAVLFTNPASAK